MARFLLISLLGFSLIFSFLIFGKDIFSNLINRYSSFQATVIEPISKEEIESESEEEIEREETFSESEKNALLQRIDELEERVDFLSQQLADLTNKSQKIKEVPEIEEITETEEEEITATDEKEEEIKENELGQEIGQKPCEEISGVQPQQNKVIINELAWMGTINSANDEWIELKNISGDKINLAGWQILNKDKKIKIFFSIGDIIPLNGFYLLERIDDISVPQIKADLIYNGALKNSDEALYLFDENCQLQDLVLANPDWPNGDNSSKRTMERKSDLTWQTSQDPGGTPKRENSSGYIAPILKGDSLSFPQEEPKINLSFPEENPVNKEIEISLSLSGLKNTLYDLKISIEKEEVLSDIYNQKEEKWQSSFYYLKEIFSGSSFEGQFKLKIKEEKRNFRGEADILVRIKESGKTQYFEFVDKIKIIEPELLPDTTPPKVFFNLEPFQTNLSFTISWQAEDPVEEFATTSGLDGFFLQYSVSPSDLDGIQYQDKDGNWKSWQEGEILEISRDQKQLILLGKDEFSYNFKIKARDLAQNESVWQEGSTKISLAKIVLISEVYYDVGDRKFNDILEKESDNEWIEIYNASDLPVNISGWEICDNISCDEISTLENIPATAFALITAKNTTWDFWEISPEAIKIVLDGPIGNGLKDGGDQLVLKRKDGTEVDEVSWNKENGLLTGEGKSIARIDKEVDTNSFTDWQILEFPNPGQ